MHSSVSRWWLLGSLPLWLVAGCQSPGTSPLACRFANYGQYQDDAWTHLPAIGMKYVFMNAPPPDQVAQVAEQLARHNLIPLVLRGSADLSTPDAVKVMDTQLATCARLGVAYMFLSPKRHGAPKELIYERLRAIGDRAKAHGVIVALETHPDLGTNGDVHLATMRAVNHRHIRVNFDTANIHYYNKDTDAVTELKKIVEYVATVEVKDHNGQFETWHFPALGRGVVDIPGVLELLCDHGYRGPITLEIEGIKGVKRDLPAIKKDIEDSLAYLRSLGVQP